MHEAFIGGNLLGHFFTVTGLESIFLIMRNLFMAEPAVNKSFAKSCNCSRSFSQSMIDIAFQF